MWKYKIQYFNEIDETSKFSAIGSLGTTQYKNKYMKKLH